MAGGTALLKSVFYPCFFHLQSEKVRMQLRGKKNWPSLGWLDISVPFTFLMHLLTTGAEPATQYSFIFPFSGAPGKNERCTNFSAPSWHFHGTITKAPLVSVFPALLLLSSDPLSRLLHLMLTRKHFQRSCAHENVPWLAICG